MFMLSKYMKYYPSLRGVKFSLDVPQLKEIPATTLNGVLLKTQLQPVTPKSDAKLAQEHCSHWAIEYGLAEEGNKHLAANLAWAISYNCHEESNESVSLYTDFSFVFFVLMDDILDEEWRNIKREDLIQAYNLFYKILDNQHPSHLPHLQFPRFIPICRALEDINQRTASKKHDKHLFLASLRNHFNHCIKEYDQRKRQKLPSSKEYLETHAITLGAELFREFVFFVRGLSISTEIEQDPVFKQFKYKQLELMSLANSILSFVKELQEDKEDNYILIRQRERQCSIQEAFNDGMSLYNRHFIKMLELMDELKKKHENQPSLNEMIHFIWENVQSNLVWSLQTARYQEKALITEDVNLNQLTQEEKKELLLL